MPLHHCSNSRGAAESASWGYGPISVRIRDPLPSLATKNSRHPLMVAKEKVAQALCPTRNAGSRYTTVRARQSKPYHVENLSAFDYGVTRDSKRLAPLLLLPRHKRTRADRRLLTTYNVTAALARPRQERSSRRMS
jgi:hypothetical protein